MKKISKNNLTSLLSNKSFIKAISIPIVTSLVHTFLLDQTPENNSFTSLIDNIYVAMGSGYIGYLRYNYSIVRKINSIFFENCDSEYMEVDVTTNKVTSASKVILDALEYSSVKDINSTKDLYEDSNLQSQFREEIFSEGIVKGKEIRFKSKTGTLIPVKIQFAEMMNFNTVRLLLKDNSIEIRANHDTVTGVYSKSRFEEKVSEVKTLPLNQNYVIMVDLDDFKSINDNYGHSSGDFVLEKVAQRLDRRLKTYYDKGISGFFGRYGGDEFSGFLQVEINQKNSMGVLLEDLLHSLIHDSETMILDPNSNNEYIQKFSIRVSKYYPGDLKGSLDAADKALYHIKRNGKGGFDFYNT
jgi:diguanylate cyclase (GGDEF)-like protein